MLASIIQPQMEPGGSAYGSVVKTPGSLRDTCLRVADTRDVGETGVRLSNQQ